MIEKFMPPRLAQRLEWRKMKKNVQPLESLQGKKYETLFAEEQILSRLDALADGIISDYGDSMPVMIPIANGAAIAASDLIRLFMDKGKDLPMEFIKVSTYGKTEKSSGRKKKFDINRDLVIGRDILLMDDILDTGNTLSFVSEKLLKMGAKSVKTLALFRKPENVRETPFEADYVGFSIPNVWVEGYGLDSRYFGRGRRDVVAVLDDKNFTLAA